MHLKSFTHKLRLLTLIFPLIALAGCWGNGSGPSSTSDAKPEGPPLLLRDSAVDGGFEPSAQTGMPNATIGDQGSCGAGNLGAWPYFNCNFVTSTLGPSSAPVSHDVPGTQSLIQFAGDAGAENIITALAGDIVEVTVHAMSWEPDPFNNLAIVQLTFWDEPGGRSGGGKVLRTIERYAGSEASAGDYEFILLPQDGAELSDWTEITFSGNAPAGSMSAQVLLIHILLPSTANTGAIYWDDLSLQSFSREPPPPLRDSAVDGGFEPSAETGMPNATIGNQGGCGAGNLGAWPYFNCNFVTSTLGPSSAPLSHDIPGTQSLIQFGGDAGAENIITALAGDIVEVTVHAMSWEPDPFNNLAIVQLTFWDEPGGRTGGGQQVGDTIERLAGSEASAGDYDFTLLPQDGAELSDWTEITFSGTAPVGSMSAQVLLIHILLDTTSNNGAIYWDDLILQSFGGEPVDPEPEPDYQLIWSDEFDLDGEPNPNNWTMETGYGNFGWGNDEWQLYTDLPENVRVENGTLVIDALCEDDPVDPGPGASLVDGGFEPPGTDDASAADQACLGGVLAGSAWDCVSPGFASSTLGPNSAPVSHDAGGTQSLKLSANGSVTNSVESLPGDNVELTAWAINWEGEPFKNFASLQLTFWDGPNGSGNQVGVAIETFLDASGLGGGVDMSVIQDGLEVSDWTEINVSAVAPAGTQSARVTLAHVDFFAGADAIYWDDVSLTATPPVGPTVCGGKRDDSITSARINTSGKFDFKYGKVEANIRVPVGEGAWSAFWMLGANFKDVGWPFSGEIDITEIFSNGSDEYTTNFAMHWCDETKQTNPDVCFPVGRTFVTGDLTLFPDSLGDDFHVYSAVWDEERIVGKIDGRTYFTRAIDVDTMDEFLKEFFLILNVAIGGTLGGAPDATTTWPQRMLVDWVRVYQEVP